MSRHAAPPIRDTLTMTPRAFAAIIGGIMLIAAIAALNMHIEADYIGALTDGTVDCGTALSPADSYSNAPKWACEEAIGDRRAWAWPLGAVAVAVLLGALAVRTKKAGAGPA